MDELRRHITAGLVEFRAAPDAKTPGMLAGYAATFNAPSRDLGGWTEVIDPHCFDECLAEGVRVLCRSEHDSRLLLGTTDAGTLRVTIDDVGLHYEVDLPDTNAGRDAAVLAERGDYRFSSFAFHELDGCWDVTEDDSYRWRVTKARLVDTAPVADPAYWSSTVAKRDLPTAAVEPPNDSEASDLELRSTQTRAARLRLYNLSEGSNK